MSAINLGGGGTNKKIINEILGQVHKHDNLPVLDGLDENSNGKLVYKGQEIITSSSSSTILATQVVETTDRKFVSNFEKDSLAGVKGNLQSQLDIIKIIAEGKMAYKGSYKSNADMISQNRTPSEGDTCFVDNDEKENNVSSIYIYSNGKWNLVKKDANGWIAATKAPSNTKALWLDTSSNEPKLKWYNGTSWITISGGGGNGNGWVASNVPPTTRTTLWLDVSGKYPELKWFNGTTWQNISGVQEILASNIIQEVDYRLVTESMLELLSKLSEDSTTGNLVYNGIVIDTSGINSILNNLINDTKVGIDNTYSSFKISEELAAKQPLLGYIPEDISKKGKSEGYTPLDTNTKVDRNYLYDYNFVVNDEAERLALTDMYPGNICYEESTTKTFIYSSNNDWQLIAKGDSIVIGKNNFKAERNPVYSDDETAGYLEGSTWINKYTKKAYICTDSTADAAVWELMAGQVTLNIGEIIPFSIDTTTFEDMNDGNYKYAIPKMEIDVDYIELSLNGIELEYKKEYSLLNEGDESFIIIPSSKITQDCKLFGEIFKYDMEQAEEQMLKSVYDANKDGKVDLAEISDYARKINEWKQLTKYEVNELVFYNGALYRAVELHVSSTTFDESKWTLVMTEAINLAKFTTVDLLDDIDHRYVTDNQLENIDLIPSINTGLNNTARQTNINTADIRVLKTDTTTLKNRLDNIKFTTLKDTPNYLEKDAFLKVNSLGNAIELISEPLFPMKALKDSSNSLYSRIEIPNFKHMEVTEIDNKTNEYTLELNAKSIDLKDMPKEYVHGKVLVADENNQKYVLANKEELTMSIENFTKTIYQQDWVLNSDNKYECTVFHDMGSEALIVSFTNANKEENKNITYQVLNKSNIKVISSEDSETTVTINCALGAGNGYWQYLMDWSKIDFVDDSTVRLDRAYSSDKLLKILSLYCKKTDYYEKNMSDTKFALKTLEHSHSNKDVLDKLNVDQNGDVTFNDVRLLTEMNPFTISQEEDFNTTELTEIVEFETLAKDNNLQALIASEIIIKNTSESKDLTFKVKDGTIDLMTVKIEPNEVQKYHLGISKKIKLFLSGEAKTLLTISAF